MNKKTLLIVSILAIAVPAMPSERQVQALEYTASTDAYAAGQFGLSYFASYRVREFNGVLDRFGSGPEISYAISRPFTVAIEGISENPRHSFFDEAGVNTKYYVPISDSGASFYALLGYTRRFEDLPGQRTASSIRLLNESTTPRPKNDRTDDVNRANFGLGLELRGKRNGLFGFGTLHGFVDGRWTTDFAVVGHALFRAGGGFGF